jgi:hypothetical protein
MKPADRKRQLIAEGRIYRAEALVAKEAVRSAMQPDVLVRSIVGQAAMSGLSLLRSKESFNQAFRTGLPVAPSQLASLLPVALRIWSMLPKNKSALRPVLLGAAGAGVAAGAAAWIFTRAKRRPAAEADTDAQSSTPG